MPNNPTTLTMTEPVNGIATVTDTDGKTIEVMTQYGYGRVEDQAISNADLPPLFKVLSKDGKPTSGGYDRFEYKLPTRGKPGAWVEVKDALNMCRTGLHLTPWDQINQWMHGQGERVFMAEVDGPALMDRNSHDGKVCARRVRLVAEVPKAVVNKIRHRGGQSEKDFVEHELMKWQTEYWTGRYEEVWKILSPMLPKASMTKSEIEFLHLACNPGLPGHPNRVSYQYNRDDIGSARAEFMNARKTYLRSIGQDETEEMRRERLSVAQSNKMMRSFAAAFFDVRKLERVLVQFGKRKGQRIVDDYFAERAAKEQALADQYQTDNADTIKWLKSHNLKV